MDGECLLCSVDVTDELTCKLCRCLLHFSCAFGAPVNNQATRGLFKKGNYICPVCLVSQNNDLVLQTVSRNQQHNSRENFPHPDPFGDIESEGHTEEEEEVEVVVNTVNHTANPPGNDNFLLAMLGTPTPRTTGQQDNFTRGMLGTPQHTSPTHPSVSPTHSSPLRMNNPAQRKSQETAVKVKDLSNGDKARAGRLTYILKTLKNLPAKTSTLLIGDSNSHGIDGRELDPDGSIAVRSFSGLCIVSCAYALKNHKFSYPKVKCVVFSLGINDILHGPDEHWSEDYSKHVKSLQTEASRVFPKAKLCFVLPFHGLPKASPDDCKDLEGKIKTLLPKFKRYQPPFMKGKVCEDGVHLSDAGMGLYKKFLQKTFIPRKPQPKSDTTTQVKNRDVVESHGEYFRVRQDEYPPLKPPPPASYFQCPPLAQPLVSAPYSQPRTYYDPRSQVLSEIASMVQYMLGPRSYSPQRSKVEQD